MLPPRYRYSRIEKLVLAKGLGLTLFWAGGNCLPCQRILNFLETVEYFTVIFFATIPKSYLGIFWAKNIFFTRPSGCWLGGPKVVGRGENLPSKMKSH